MMIPKQIENSGDVPGFNNEQHLDALEKYASKIPEGSKVSGFWTSTKNA